MLRADGKKYVGDFKYVQMEGYGTVTFFDGEVYIGGFKSNTFSVQGILVTPDGKKVISHD